MRKVKLELKRGGPSGRERVEGEVEVEEWSRFAVQIS